MHRDAGVLAFAAPATMPHPLQKFRSYEIAEDSRGASLELWRSDREVVCLASDPLRHVFAELHVLATVDVTHESAGPITESFRHQTQALLRLEHSHVIALREAGEDEGALFYVTEFIDGETLDTYLARCNPLPAWLAAELAVQVTRGLLAVRHESSLLASAQVLNSRLSLEGEMTSDLCLKLSDFALGELPPPRAKAPFEIEHRAAREVGRLLLYALSGMVSEKVTARTLAALPVPVELAHLLAGLLDTGAARPTTDLTGLLEALEASRQNPALSTWPARLPQALRPRLMLQSHFPSLGELAGRLGRGYRLERTAFDAVQPYAQRAFADDTRPVTVQLLPPDRLMAQTYLPRIRLAAERVTAAHSAHLLRVLEVASDQTWFIEESAPRTSVDAARRLRRELTSVESAMLLREIDRAVVAAEKLGLSAAALAPQQMFLDFITKAGGPASPAEAELSSQRIDQWPPFRIRLRTHPVTAQFMQPQRFRREHLLADGPCTRAGSGPSTLGSIEAADYAALFTWLCGGAQRVPSDLSLLVRRTLAGSGEPDRRKFLDRIGALLPKTSKPATRLAFKPSKSAPAAAKQERKAPSRSPARLVITQAVTSARPTAVPSLPVKIEPSPVLAKHDPDFPALIGSEMEAEVVEDEGGGFAEMLFGGSNRLTRSVESLGTTAPVASAEIGGEVEEMPVGTLFAGTWPQSTGLSEREDFQPMSFHPTGASADGPRLGRLLVLVVLAALVIAIIMAHVTGLAPWR